jgi:hypothetical protein
MENGLEVWYMEFKNFAEGRFTTDSCERTIKIQVRFSGSVRYQIGQSWY